MSKWICQQRAKTQQWFIETVSPNASGFIRSSKSSRALQEEGAQALPEYAVSTHVLLALLCRCGL
eukprot:11184163-Lingulodinium_polyedra.AAC.1